MLEKMLDGQLLFILVGVCALAGVVSRMVVSVSLGRLTRAAQNMSKSAHPLMKLVRAKFEHACMVSDKVQNVKVFVEKYIYEYKILGIRLHGWMRLEKDSAWGSLLLGILAASAEYVARGMSDQVLKCAVFGAVIGMLLFLMRACSDEGLRMRAVRTYMVDYLENIYARRLEKNRPAQKNPELSNPERPRPREEVPMPREEPILDPPTMPEPNLPPVTGSAPDASPNPVGQLEAAKAQTGEKGTAGFGAGKESGPGTEAVPEHKASDKSAAKSQDKFPDKPQLKPREPRSKEVMIREILEEFLA